MRNQLTETIHCLLISPPWGQVWGYYSPTGTPYWGAGATYLKLAAIQSTSLTFIFVEDAGNNGTAGYNLGTWVVRWTLGPAPAFTPQNFVFVDPVPMFHGNISTYSFADGHSAFHKWRHPIMISKGILAANGANVSSLTGIPGFPTINSDPDHDYVFQGYRHPKWAP